MFSVLDRKKYKNRKRRKNRPYLFKRSAARIEVSQEERSAGFYERKKVRKNRDKNSKKAVMGELNR